MTDRTEVEAEYFAAIVDRSAAGELLRTAQARFQHGPRIRRLVWAVLTIGGAAISVAFAVGAAHPALALPAAVALYVGGTLRHRAADKSKEQQELILAGARMAEAEGRVRAATAALGTELTLAVA